MNRIDDVWQVKLGLEFAKSDKGCSLVQDETLEEVRAWCPDPLKRAADVLAMISKESTILVSATAAYSVDQNFYSGAACCLAIKFELKAAVAQSKLDRKEMSAVRRSLSLVLNCAQDQPDRQAAVQCALLCVPLHRASLAFALDWRRQVVTVTASISKLIKNRFHQLIFCWL